MKHAILLSVVVIFGCGAREKEPDTTLLRGGSDAVVGVSSDSPAMAAAIAEAKRKLPHFISELQKPKGRTFEIKSPFTTSTGDKEHMWVDVTRYKDGVFYGALDSDPLDVPNLKAGSKVKVRKEDVSDWLIVNGGIEGGFTVKVLNDLEEQGKVAK